MKTSNNIFKLPKRVQSAFWDLVNSGMFVRFETRYHNYPQTLCPCETLTVTLDSTKDMELSVLFLYLSGTERRNAVNDYISRLIHKHVNFSLNFPDGVNVFADYHTSYNVQNETLFDVTFTYRKFPRFPLFNRAKERLAIQLAISEDEKAFNI